MLGIKKPDRQYSISVRKAVHQFTVNTHSDVNLCEEMSNTEMAQAIHNMKCGKAPGPDNIHPEFIKNLAGTLRFEVASSFLVHLHAPQPPKNMEKSQHHSNPETWQGR